jgi:hypothetical protein
VCVTVTIAFLYVPCTPVSVLLSLHVHMALAQRLNELAAANSEGLLQYVLMT